MGIVDRSMHNYGWQPEEGGRFFSDQPYISGRQKVVRYKLSLHKTPHFFLEEGTHGKGSFHKATRNLVWFLALTVAREM